METTLLVVEDDEFVRSSLEKLLDQQGYRVLTAPHGSAALDILQQQVVHLVLTDLRVEPVNGLELLAHVRALSLGTAVIVLTGYGSLETAIRALRAGADDYLLKPCEPGVLLERVQAALTRRRAMLESLKAETAWEAVQALTRVLATLDPETFRHSHRVAHFARELGRAMQVACGERHELWLAGLLHDIGKLGIGSALLKKPGPLSMQERRRVRLHPLFSVNILRPIGTLQSLLPAVLHHHERYDGRGYPNGLSGKSIPAAARLLAVVDSFSAMTEDRSYRAARSCEEALSLLEQGAGRQWDPAIVQVWVRLVRAGDLDVNPPNARIDDELPRLFAHMFSSPWFPPGDKTSQATRAAAPGFRKRTTTVCGSHQGMPDRPRGAVYEQDGRAGNRTVKAVPLPG